MGSHWSPAPGGQLSLPSGVRVRGCASEGLTVHTKMINTLPRWFGRKKSKEEKTKSHIEISQPFAPVHREGLSSLGQSLNSLVEAENENLYVNGAVPAGQFREYFMAPAEQAGPKLLSSERSSLHGSVRSLSRSIVKRTESIRSALSGRSHHAHMRKSVSADNVLDESCSTTLMAEGETEYYNLTYLGRHRENLNQHVLNRENLNQHDQITLSTSFLGHTLLTAIGQDLESDQDTDRDSGALSMGGGWALAPCTHCTHSCTLLLGSYPTSSHSQVFILV